MFPYDSIREYAEDLEKQGKLIRINEMDQDKYEMSALVYKLNDRMEYKSPAFLSEKVKINDKVHDSPVIGNLYNSFGTVAQCFGVENTNDNQGEMYEAAVSKIMSFQDKNFKWKMIDPVIIDKSAAPCKEVILTGEDVDLGNYPWIKNNPADGSQYISAGSVIMEDKDLGKNVGTYRMQVKGPRKVGVYFTNQSHGYKFMMQALERDEESVKVSVAVGIDPISWMMSSTRLAGLGLLPGAVPVSMASPGSQITMDPSPFGCLPNSVPEVRLLP